MNTTTAGSMPSDRGRNGHGSSPWTAIRDIVIIAFMIPPSFFISVVIFVVGFLIIPSSAPSLSSIGEYDSFLSAATRLQDMVIVILPATALAAGAARLLGTRLSTAILIEWGLNAAYWVALLAVYIAGIHAGVFAL